MPAARARPGTNGGDRTNAELCFACRSRAKVSSFPLADTAGAAHACALQRSFAQRSSLMNIRSGIFITAAVVCHLLLASGIVTSQTLPPATATDPATAMAEASAINAAARTSAQTAAQTEEEVTIRAIQQEKDGSAYHLRGSVE